MDKSITDVLQIDCAIDRVCGDSELLKVLMQKIIDKYSDVEPPLLKLLQEKKSEEAHRLVHSLKGLLATIGAQKAYNKTVAFEVHLKAGYINLEDDLFMKDMRNFINAHKEALEAAKKFCETT